MDLFAPSYILRIQRGNAPTAWHPTEVDGPFAVIVRGVFDTPIEAAQWAWAHLGPDRSSWEVVYRPGEDPWHLENEP